MNATAVQLLNEATTLPEQDRAELAAELIRTLDPQVDKDATVAWSGEIQRRLAELDSGEVRPIPWTEARKMIMGQSDGAKSR